MSQQKHKEYGLCVKITLAYVNVACMLIVETEGTGTMKYHTRTKWIDGDMTVSELSFDSIKAAAEHVVSEGDHNTG